MVSFEITMYANSRKQYKLKKLKNPFSYSMKSVVCTRRNLIAFSPCVLLFIQNRRPHRHESYNSSTTQMTVPSEQYLAAS